MKKPIIGMLICDERLGICEIIKIHRAGTIDVMALDGRCYRISGLSF